MAFGVKFPGDRFYGFGLRVWSVEHNSKGFWACGLGSRYGFNF